MIIYFTVYKSNINDFFRGKLCTKSVLFSVFSYAKNCRNRNKTFEGPRQQIYGHQCNWLLFTEHIGKSMSTSIEIRREHFCDNSML